jgi:hypothetical protein
LYQQALEESGKQYFLDKTPRYYFILQELQRVFPDAKYIILFRNPLAVLGSVLRTWVKGRLLGLYRFREDLLQAPNLLVQGVQDLDGQAIVTHYETLVNTPQNEVQRMCHWLNIEFVPRVVHYSRSDLPQWSFGDQDHVYKQKEPTATYVDRWIKALDDPQIWRLTDDYLMYLGSETIEKMGYNYDELRDILETHRPSQVDLWTTFSLVWLLEMPENERSRWERWRVRILNSLRQRGVWGTLVTGVRKAGRSALNASRISTLTERYR